ncbi:tetratricopeptide repeat protein [bacterium]|nr:tetratricopeptide repeat protein [bacterium]
MSKVDIALEAFKKGNYKEALESFQEALEQDNNNPHILNNMGLCHLYLEDDINAEKAFLEALSYDDKIVQVYINLADLYYRQHEMLKAIEILQNGVYKLPDNPALRHYLARVYIDDSRYDIAIDQLDAVLEISPKNYDAYWDLGRVYFELGVWDMAISNYERVLEFVDNNPLIYYNVALAYESNDEVDKAISNHLKAIAINPEFAHSYKNLGVLFLARGEKEDAKEYFEEYLKLNIPEEEKNNISNILKKLN